MTWTEETDEWTSLLRHPRSKESRWGPRYTVAVMGCLGLVVEYCQRVNLSVAIVAMAGTLGSNYTEVIEECPNNDNTTTTTVSPVYRGEFNWDKEIQGVVLGAFFWGYATTNIIGGRASEYLGGKMVFGMGIITSSFLSLISPFCARASVGVFVACRVLLGAAQGVTFPAINTMLATWVVPVERSKFSTIVYSGFQLGSVVGMTASGWLAASDFLGGWPSAFYVFGVAGLVWGVAWCACVYDRPEDHPRIPYRDLRMLRQHQDSVKSAEVVAIPWRAIVTSLPFWAVMAVTAGNDYCFYTLLTGMPTYLGDVQHIDLANNGLLSALPYLLMWAWGVGWAVLMDGLAKGGHISIVTVRRLSMAVALYGPMCGLVGMVFVRCNPVLAVTLLCVSVMLSGAVNSGHMCSHQDLAPNLAGTLLGTTNTLGAVAGIASSTITGIILQENAAVWGWRQVFLISIAFYLISCTLYVVFISADVQPWNDVNFAGRDEDEDSEGPIETHYLPDEGEED
nr:sialin-like [Procambarus clarkii]